jgi:hypothetical protein
VNLLDASTADESSDQIAIGSELRAVALMNLGIVETWSGRFDDAERHLSDGAALAQTIGRPCLEVACRAHQLNRAPLDIAQGARSPCAHNHQIPASPSHQVGLQDACVTTTPPGLYRIRIKGRLGATALSAFPTMVPEVEGSDTVLTGPLTDRSAVFGVLAQIEALGLELLELRQIWARPKPPESGDNRSPDAV